MAVIFNQNNTAGYTTTASKYLNDNTLQSKYSILKSLNADAVHNMKTLGEMSGVNGAEPNDKPLSSFSSVAGLLTKMQDFRFCPPSDNLWVLRIKSREQNGSLGTLYNSIIAVNNSWKSKVATGWKIDMKGMESKNLVYYNMQTYIQEFDSYEWENLGIFLAQNISFSPISITINDNTFNGIPLYGGFLTPAKILQSRNPSNNNLNINFLVSNWDINDVLIDPWIAAVAQKGLIEDGKDSPCIKANIYVDEYSASLPYSEDFTQMVHRKEYVFKNCTPIRRGEVNKNYDSISAGEFKNSIVTFLYDDYTIKYL